MQQKLKATMYITIVIKDRCIIDLIYTTQYDLKLTTGIINANLLVTTLVS